MGPLLIPRAIATGLFSTPGFGNEDVQMRLSATVGSFAAGGGMFRDRHRLRVSVKAGSVVICEQCWTDRCATHR